MPMSATPSGMVTSVSLAQPINVQFSSFFSCFGRLTDFRPVQLAKALLPMAVTLSGMVTLCKFSQL